MLPLCKTCLALSHLRLVSDQGRLHYFCTVTCPQVLLVALHPAVYSPLMARAQPRWDILEVLRVH